MRNKIAANTESKMKLNGTMGTNNYIVIYSGVNRRTRTRACVIIWIYSSIIHIVIIYTCWSERMR
jgi:hypothetical protein